MYRAGNNDPINNANDLFARYMKSYGANGQPTPQQMYETHCFDLPLSLSEVYNGCTKRISIKAPQVSKVLEIDVKRGWKAGTKIVFNAQNPGSDPKPLPFNVEVTIKDKPHELFERVGSDIVYTAKVPLRNALCSRGSVQVPIFPGDATMSVDLKDHPKLCSPNYTFRYSGMGLPFPTNPLKRGDLVVKFDVIFPDVVQESVLEKIRRLIED